MLSLLEILGTGTVAGVIVKVADSLLSKKRTKAETQKLASEANLADSQAVKNLIETSQELIESALNDAARLRKQCNEYERVIKENGVLLEKYQSDYQKKNAEYSKLASDYEKLTVRLEEINKRLESLVKRNELLEKIIVENGINLH